MLRRTVKRAKLQSPLSPCPIMLWVALCAAAADHEKVHVESVTALAEPQVRQQLLGLGAAPVGNSPQELHAFLRAEIERWTRVVKQANIGLDP